LREADGALARQLSREDAQQLRRTVLAAVATAPPVRQWSLTFTVIAGSLAAASAALVLSTAIGSSGPPPASSVPGAAVERGTSVQAPTDGERRQLHFATPGGTRIIWVFDTDFEVKGTLP
jgi:hypothetical protein